MATRPPANSGKLTVNQLKRAQTAQRQMALKGKRTAVRDRTIPAAAPAPAPARPKPKRQASPAPPPPPAPKKVKRGIVPEHLRPFLFKKQQKPRGK